MIPAALRFEERPIASCAIGLSLCNRAFGFLRSILSFALLSFTCSQRYVAREVSPMTFSFGTPNQALQPTATRDYIAGDRG